MIGPDIEDAMVSIPIVAGIRALVNVILQVGKEGAVPDKLAVSEVCKSTAPYPAIDHVVDGKSRPS